MKIIKIILNQSFIKLLYILPIFIVMMANPLLQAELSTQIKQLPVSHKGRFIPLDLYARDYLFELYGKESLNSKEIQKSPLKEKSALNFLLHLFLYGHTAFDDTPLFKIHYAKLKKKLHLPLKRTHFSYKELKTAIFENEKTNLALLRLLIPYIYIHEKEQYAPFIKSKKIELTALAPNLFATTKKGNLYLLTIPKGELWHFLKPGLLLKHQLDEKLVKIKNNKMYVEEALKIFSSMVKYNSWKGIGQTQNQSFKILPGKTAGTWYPLESLQQNATENFTAYEDDSFKNIKNIYFELENVTLTKKASEALDNFNLLAKTLYASYSQIEGTIVKEAFEKKVIYPTKKQLQIEQFYGSTPLLKWTIGLYLLATLGTVFGISLKNKRLKTIGLALTIAAFLSHTALLAFRSFILMRPPVSNMFETVIYVPWVAQAAGLLSSIFNKNRVALLASILCSLALLLLLEAVGMRGELLNLQAVLDSNYWLTIHVLLVVASYGIFFLSAMIGQFYLIYSFFNQKENEEMKFLSSFLLQTMYVGLFMLIVGTILGGVWALESWGRFWDWDPKESWAFISASIYLIFIHGYRFNLIGSFGLAFGSLIGWLSITFTWYGVNYILGTGLHSYGFGTGNDIYYYIFLLFELAFLTIICYKHQKQLEIKS